MSRIIVVGSLNMDLVIETPKMPQIGQTLMGTGFMTSPGGKGANQAVAVGKLGGDVTMVGCVGCDAFGQQLLDNLQKNHVKTEKIKKIENAPTGIAVITLYNGDNFIIVDPGANSFVMPDDAPADFFRPDDVVVFQLEIPIETAKQIAKAAKRSGATVLLNPAPACALDDDFFESVSIITPNETECEDICGVAVTDKETASRAVSFFRKKGVRTVVITAGGNGSFYNDGDEVFHAPCVESKVVDTTSAGDSFTGALAVAKSRGADIHKAILVCHPCGGHYR